MTDQELLKEGLLAFLREDIPREETLSDPVSGEALQEYISSDGERASFADTFEKLRQEKKAGRDSVICKRACLRKDTLARMKAETILVQRDYLWALAFGMQLTLSETELLFASCSQYLYGRYRMNAEELRRDRAFEYFIRNRFYDVDLMNIILSEAGIAPIGNEIIS